MRDDGSPKNGNVIPFRRPEKSAENNEEEIILEKEEKENTSPRKLYLLKKNSPLVRRIMLLVPSWISPNSVTIFRGLLVLPLWYSLRTNNFPAALALFCVAMILDFVDGALAEVRNQSTPLGAFLDPLVDKILVCGTLVAMIDRLPSPFLPLILVCLATAIILTLIRVVKMQKIQQGLTVGTIAAKPAGKYKVWAEVITLILMIGGFWLGNQQLIWLSGGSLVVAFCYACASVYSQISD